MKVFSLTYKLVSIFYLLSRNQLVADVANVAEPTISQVHNPV